MASLRLDARRLHRDDEAQMVFIGVFGAVGLVIFLAMIINVAANLREKIHLQNTADATALAAGQVWADGMNYISDNNVAITELVAIKSVIEGVRATAKDPWVQYQYFEAYVTCEFLAKFPIVGPIFEVLKRLYLAASNYCCLLSSGGYANLLDGIASLSGKTASRLVDSNRFFIKGNVIGPLVMNAANRVAKENDALAGRVGARLLVLPPPLPLEQKPQWAWDSPTYYGSQSNKVHEDRGRRGYYHVYRLKEDRYDLDKGPFRAFREEAKRPFAFLGFALWDIPFLDQSALVGFCESLLEECARRLFGGGGLGDPEGRARGFLSGFSWNANGVFHKKAFRKLSANLGALGEGPWDLIGTKLADVYRKLWITSVVYGKPREGVAISGKNDMGPFARQLGGFLRPTKTTKYGAVAVAQAQVYNPASWDTFTQYWDVRLIRTQRLPLYADGITGPWPVSVALPGELFPQGLSLFQRLGSGRVVGGPKYKAELYH